MTGFISMCVFIILFHRITESKQIPLFGRRIVDISEEINGFFSTFELK